jgi:RimJ/RimL family protein N-acetyltransferase
MTVPALIRRTLSRVDGIRDDVAMAIRLRRLERSDIGAAHAIVDDGDTLRFTRVPDPVPAGWLDAWFERYEQGRADGTREAFAIVENDGFVGLALAPSIQRDERTVELGYLVVPAARGRGIATEALRALTAWALDELDPVRIELLISPANTASRIVAERCGYTYEGTLRSTYLKPGVWEDTEVWSLLATDPLPG